MDEEDLAKTDPKRFGLEADKIILETVKEAFKTHLNLAPSSIQEDEEKLKTAEEPLKQLVLRYNIEQKKYLNKVIDVYQDEIFKLIKEDSL
jgi:hypothetical protein